MPEYADLFREPSRRFRIEGEVPLRSQLGPVRLREGALAVPEEEWRMLADRTAWRETPPFDESGRSAMAVRKSPLVLGSDTIAGYKLKGIGAYDERTGVATPPKDEAYERRMLLDLDPRDTDVRNKLVSLLPQILIHMGIDECGEFYPVPDPAKPKGGLSHGRGQREFENAAALHQAGVPACTPVLWGRYPDLQWQGEPMQWVILGLSNVDPRSSACFEPEMGLRGLDYSSYMKAVIARQSDIFNPSNLGRPALSVSESLGRGVGVALRAAHDKAGVARFAGHTGNFTYVPEDRSVVMHDFDSSVKLDSIAPKARAMTRIRDLESAMFGLLHSLAHSRMFYLADNETLFRQKNPLAQILHGYFPDVDFKVEERKLADLCVWAIKDFGYNKPQHEQAMWLTVAGETVTRELTALNSRIYRRSGLNEVDALPMSEAQLMRSFDACTAQRKMLAVRKMQEMGSTLPPWARVMLGI